VRASASPARTLVAVKQSHAHAMRTESVRALIARLIGS
jgi:hypothetical protein